jgi:hypothetical protein
LQVVQKNHLAKVSIADSMADIAGSELRNGAWQQVVTRHISHLPPEQAAQFRQSINIREFIDAVTKELGIVDWDEWLRSRGPWESDKRYRVWKIVNRSLRPLKRFGPIIEVAAQVNSLIGCSIWAPLKLVVKVRFL